MIIIKLFNFISFTTLKEDSVAQWDEPAVGRRAGALKLGVPGLEHTLAGTRHSTSLTSAASSLKWI